MPDEYYNMLPVDFELMMNGHIKRIDLESSNHRRAAFLICKTLGFKKDMPEFMQFWPLSIDAKNEPHGKIEVSEADWQKIMATAQKKYPRKKRR